MSRNIRPSWRDHINLVVQRGREILNTSAQESKGRGASELARRLLESRGEATTLALATDLVEQLSAMSQRELDLFLDRLASQFGVDTMRLSEAVERWTADRESTAAQIELAAAAEPRRQELFRRINMASGGTAALLAMRQRLLVRGTDSTMVASVDEDFRHLLRSWFNRGFLRLEVIDWHTPAAVLEKLIRYEAVHEIHGWEDLRRRLAADRRCFAFFHPTLPEEPIIFLEVALTSEVPRRIAPLLDPNRPLDNPSAATVATFYSISSCQPGLRGISFGNFLIKQVTSELHAELPRLRTFATLSPMPGFARCILEGRLTRTQLEALAGDAGADLCHQVGCELVADAVIAMLKDPSFQRQMASPHVFRRIALAYLVQVKRPDGRAFDPVADFHLANGARLEQINLGANPSRGGESSFGIMANYVYEAGEVEVNHERYVGSGMIRVARGLTGEVNQVSHILREAMPANR